MLRFPVALFTLFPVAAHAFSVGTIATKACHERITLDALDAAGIKAQLGSVTDDDRALVEGLLFPVEGKWDRRTIALLIGARDNDFHGASPSNFKDLAEVHLSPVLQNEHCLRAPGEDGAKGDVAAIAKCREFIVAQLKLAAEAEPDATELVRVALAQGPTVVELPSAEIHLGRALHAVQDSFAHQLRGRENLGTVRSVFNYLDPNVSDAYILSRDGHGHLSEYDACEGELAAPRVAAATRASAALIAALYLPASSPIARLSDATASLDLVLHYEPACTNGAAWCADADALLNPTIPLPPQGCSSTGGEPLWAVALAFFLLMWRRGVSLVERRMKAVAALLIVALPTSAFAEQEPLRLRPTMSVGASAERGGALVSLGARLPLRGRFELYTDLELNPWWDLLGGKLSWGVMNVVLGATVRWATLGPVELRSGLGAGASLLLHNTVGARAGSIGPFAQLSVISALLPGPGTTRLELRPDVVLSVPSLRGIPLVYHQYRLILSLRLD